jgi:hypothetical protein
MLGVMAAFLLVKLAYLHRYLLIHTCICLSTRVLTYQHNNNPVPRGCSKQLNDILSGSTVINRVIENILGVMAAFGW